MDGDGRQIKTEETVWDEGWQTYITETKYYLRSSMLGGKVLTEIWSAALPACSSVLVPSQNSTFHSPQEPEVKEMIAAYTRVSTHEKQELMNTEGVR